MSSFAKGFEFRDGVLLLDGKTKRERFFFSQFFYSSCEQQGEDKPLWVLLNSDRSLRYTGWTQDEHPHPSLPD